MGLQGTDLQESLEIKIERARLLGLLYQQLYPISKPSPCSFGGGYAFGVTW